MKKLLTVLILLLMSLANCFADPTVLFTAEEAVEFGTNWSPSIQLNSDDHKAAFSALQASDNAVLRIHLKSIGDDAQVQLQNTNNSWITITNNSSIQTSDTYTDFTLDDTGNVLNLAQSGYVAVKGYNCTATSVEIINGESRTHLWGAYVLASWGNYTNSQELSTGDCLTFTYTDAYTDTYSAQLNLYNSSSTAIATENIADGNGTVTFNITSPMAENTVIMGGKQLTLTKVEYTSSAFTPSSYTVWNGTTVIGSWDKSQILPATLFASAEENYILRVNYQDLGESPQLQLKNGSWDNMTESVSISGTTSKDFTISSEMKTTLNSGGLILSGANLTLTSVEVIPTYQVSVTSTNGTIYIGDTETEYTNNTRYESGSTVTLRAVANEGYRFVNWKNGDDVVSETASYTTPALSADLTLTANFIQQFTVTAATEDANKGTVAITNADANNKYDAGSTVTITATPASASYEFEKWTKTGDDTWNASESATTNPLSITGLDGNWTLTASFKEKTKDTPEITLSAFSAGDEATLTAGVFTTTANEKTISQWIGENSGVTGNKLVVKFAGAPTGEEGQSVKVAAQYIAAEYEEANAYPDENNIAVVNLDNTKYIKSIYIQLAKPGSVTVNSVALDPLYTITATSANTDQGTAAVTTVATSEGKYAYGTSVTVTATPEQGYSFSQWKVNDTSVSTNASYTFTATEDIALTAEFVVEKTVQTLKTATQKMINETVGTKVLIANSAFANASAGDIITVALSEKASGAFIVLKENSSGTSFFGSNYSSSEFASETSFTYTLTASDIELLTGENKALCVTGEGFTCGNITITSAGSITADAAHTTMYVLSVTQPTEGGTIQIGGSDAAAQKAYDNGSQVTLTAASNSGYAISSWTKDDADAGSEETLTVTFDGADISVTATFEESDPNVLWEGTQAINWNASPGQYLQLAASKFTGIALGDKLIFNMEDCVNDGQIQLTNSSWSVMAGTANAPISSGMTQVIYYVNSKMLTELANGLIISGAGFTLKSVKKEDGDGGDYSKSVWIGNTVLASDWSVYQQVAASCFADATVDQILRVKVKDLKVSPTMTLCNSSSGWPVLSGTTENTSISGGYVQYTITSDMLTELQASGLIVKGCSYTVTSVDILNADDIKPLTQSVDVENNWIWTSAPTITIHVTNPYDVAMTANAELQVTTDKLEAYTTLTNSVEIAANSSQDIALTFPSTPPAGFYKATALVNGDLARSFFFGVNPTQISSPADKQSDFDTFWSTAKNQLATIEASDEPVLTEITSKSTEARKVYLVEFKSIPDGTSGDPVTIRGYYCEPTDGEKHPVIMHYLGYDSGYAPGGQSGAPYCPSGDANPDYAEFYLSTRGQSINNRPAADRDDGISKDFTNTYGDWFAYHFGDKDSWYYRGAYMDCVRAIDFMATRETSDMDNLFAEGQSQGGALTYAAAALSGYTFKAIAPAITFMGDFPDYFEIANWPASVARANQGSMSDAEMYAFLSYFDTKNLAPQVNCPVITSIGVQDNVCPPHTNIAPYNNLPSSVTKQIVYNAELQHATNSDWYTTYMGFFGNYETAAPSNRVDRTMLETTQDIADGDIELDKVLFKNAASGDVIKIYANLSTGAKIALEPGDYSGALDGANWPDFTESPFTLKLTSSALTKIKEKGLLVRGEKFTFTKAVLYTENELGKVDSDDEETVIDEETGEADLTQLSAQDDTKTTLTQNEDGSITMTTTEAYCAAQIWFNNPETVSGNVLKVELAESSVNVTVTVQYTDGTQSQMSANTKGVAAARAATRSDSGTTIEVPLDEGKEVQNIEVKNNVAGTITIKKMQVTTINVFTSGVANLAMLKPQSNATYDTATYTLATTKGWTGATISPVDGENVSGKELLIEFTEAKQVKVAVKYRTDVEGPSKIMEKAATSVRLTLDNTKNIQEISIQPTTASIVTFKKIAVNSEESDDGTLKPGKSITLWEKAAGETLAWNEVASQDATIGEMLQEYDELLITVSGVTEGCDWPKLFLRDASSEQAGNEVLLNDIASFPYTVRIVLTGEMAEQLADGFSICGDGVTVTKLVAYRPEEPKTGDIHLADLNYGYNSSYDKGSHTITTTSRWAARGWEIGDKRYNDKNLITVKFEAVDFPVTLKMEYTTGLQTAQATSVGVPAGRTELLLEIPSGISKLNRVYLIYENPGSLKLTEASVTYQEKLKLSTAIETFEAEGVIRDGRYDTDGWYNLRGMRIQEPKTSGIYIHGGKKVVIY